MENEVDSPNISPTPSLKGVGALLRAAREDQGLSLSDIAAKTRIAERHLKAIDADRFADLAAPTYAVGFSRAYAKAVGLDQADIAARVRQQIAMSPVARPAPLPSFEPGDPARIPPSKIAWAAGLCAVVVVGLLLVYWSNYFSPEGKLPSLLPHDSASEAPVVDAVATAPSSPPPSTVPADTYVVLTANGPRVWVRVTDASGKQLLQKELAQGESWTVPAEAQSPQLRTGRPDLLQITVAGRVIPPLSTKPQVISGVLLTSAALSARDGGDGSPPAEPTDSAGSTTSGVSQPSLSTVVP